MEDILMVGMYINDKYIEKFLWKEEKLNLYANFEIDTYSNRVELLLDPRTFNVYFFGAKTRLISQEYKFLKYILTKNGDKVSALTLMRQIDSKCNPEKKKAFSYRIKSKIKNKLKKAIQEKYPDFCMPLPSEVGGWNLIDYEYSNEDKCKIITGDPRHYFDFEKYFKLLINVKDGYYYTDFQHYQSI